MKYCNSKISDQNQYSARYGSSSNTVILQKKSDKNRLPVGASDSPDVDSSELVETWKEHSRFTVTMTPTKCKETLHHNQCCIQIMYLLLKRERDIILTLLFRLSLPPSLLSPLLLASSFLPSLRSSLLSSFRSSLPSSLLLLSLRSRLESAINQSIICTASERL